MLYQENEKVWLWYEGILDKNSFKRCKTNEKNKNKFISKNFKLNKIK